MKTSDLYSLDIKDIIKSLIVAMGSAVITTLQTSLQAGSLDFNWKLLSTVALSAGFAYLGKNFFTAPSLKTAINK